MSKIDDLIKRYCPDGVIYKELGEVLKPKENINWKSNVDNSFQYIDLSSVDRVTHKISGTTTISAKTAPSRAQQIVRNGDVLFGTTRPTLKRYTVIDAGFDGQIASTGFCVLRPGDEVLTSFLFHLIGSSHFNNYVELTQKGASYPSISDAEVKKYRIPVPPLEVQYEIADILDKFSSLKSSLNAELEAELKARKIQYEHYRNRLIYPHEATTQLIELGDVATFKYGFTTRAKNSGKYRFLRITDITQDGSLSAENAKYVNDSEVDEKYLTKRGDLLVARTGATYGKTLYVDNDMPAVYASFLIRIDIDKTILSPRYYWHFTKSSSYWDQANNLMSGGGQPQFNANALKKVRVPVPSLDMQSRIVTILDKFDKLVSDISTELPAELTARQRQYEHYRDTLLTFQEVLV